MVFEVAAQSFVSTAAEAMPNAAARSVPVSLIERRIDSPKALFRSVERSCGPVGPRSLSLARLSELGVAGKEESRREAEPGTLTKRWLRSEHGLFASLRRPRGAPWSWNGLQHARLGEL